MRYSLPSLILVLCTLAANAQQSAIQGKIKDTEGDAVPYANIVVNDTTAKAKTLAFTMSDPKGNFSIAALKNATHIIVNVTAVGYTEVSKPVRLDTVQQLSIYMEKSSIRLEEIEVKARVYTDTLAINTEQMNLSKNSTLRDILDRTDGMIVSKDGGISYQGKQINKVLINGKEVFINQNKVALDNLNYEIMENVQVINNYKDKFTLDFNNIKDPVININTKPEFKGVIKGEAEGGYGIKNSFGLNGKGFYFSDALNVFATSHTNNVGQKELSQRDVLAPANKHVSATLRQTLSPLFQEDYHTRRNFSSNNSMTVRSQGEKSKTGLVLYHGYINTEKQRDEQTFIADTLARSNSQTNNDGGNFIAATTEYNHLVSERTILKNTLSMIMVRRKQTSESIDTLFTPSINSFNVYTRELPKSFAITDALKFTQLLGSNTIFDFGGEYYYERDSKDFHTQLKNMGMTDILQEGIFSKQQLDVSGSFKLRLGKMAPYAGLTLKQIEENGELANRESPSATYNLSRNIFTIEAPTGVQGTFGNLDYNIIATPVMMRIKSLNTRTLFKASQTFIYNFDMQHNLSLRSNWGYSFYNLNALFDTLVRSYNYKIINNPEHINRYSFRDDITLSWSKNDANRNTVAHLSYNFNREKDFMQSVLDSISQNVSYYSNRVFDKRYTHAINSSLDKYFYIGSAYHRLRVGGKINYSASTYPTLLNDQSAKATAQIWNPAINLGLVPRDFFIKELIHNLDWDVYTFDMDKEEISRQAVMTNRFSMRGYGAKVDWRFSFEHYTYKIQGNKFRVPDCSLFIKYEASEKLSLSLSSRALLTLFELNNYNFVNIRFEGNTLNQVNTNNNLGYMMLSTTLKF